DQVELVGSSVAQPLRWLQPGRMRWASFRLSSGDVLRPQLDPARRGRQRVLLRRGAEVGEQHLLCLRRRGLAVDPLLPELLERGSGRVALAEPLVRPADPLLLVAAFGVLVGDAEALG